MVHTNQHLLFPCPKSAWYSKVVEGCWRFRHIFSGFHLIHWIRSDTFSPFQLMFLAFEGRAGKTSTLKALTGQAGRRDGGSAQGEPNPGPQRCERGVPFGLAEKSRGCDSWFTWFKILGPSISKRRPMAKGGWTEIPTNSGR